MATLEFQPRQPAESEPELHLLLPQDSEQSLWNSLTQNFKDTFFPKKLPPLVLTSQPIPVKDIWGFYNEYKKRSATASTIIHIVLITALILGTAYLGRKAITKPVQELVTLVAPSDVVMRPAKTQSGG